MELVAPGALRVYVYERVSVHKQTFSPVCMCVCTTTAMHIRCVYLVLANQVLDVHFLVLPAVCFVD